MHRLILQGVTTYFFMNNLYKYQRKSIFELFMAAFEEIPLAGLFKKAWHKKMIFKISINTQAVPLIGYDIIFTFIFMGEV